MFQYGYTNFQQKSYAFASENQFFHTELLNRNQKLARLVNHVDTAHTAYIKAEPVAYLGIFTDFDSNQEDARYYFQQSGRMRDRNAAYAQGYVQDVSREKSDEFFREPFLRLLGAPFRTGEELEQLPSGDNDRYFPDISVDLLSSDLPPAELDEGLLLHILNELLQSQRLLLHIDRQGDEAPLYSLRVLRRIYECLPYAVRRSCGFATNVAPERFTTTNEEDRLPGAVQLCLVDGDVALPGWVPGYKILEMGKSYPVEDLERYLEFLQMLTTDSSTRKSFFDMVQEYYGFDHVGMREYNQLSKLAADLELPASVQAVETWTIAYKTLPKIKATICKRVAEKVDLPLAEQALREAQLPELKEVSDLARSADLTAAWELRMINELYAEDEQAVQKLAAAVAGCYKARCWEQALPLRRGLDFATEESAGMLQQNAQLRLKDALRLPAKYEGNKIVEALGQLLPPAIQELSDAETASYETELQKEQRHAVESVQSCQSLSQLVRFFEHLCSPEGSGYPLCRYALAAGHNFDAPNSYGSECLHAMVEYVKVYPLPVRLIEMDAFASDVKALTCSALYASPVIQNAAKPAEVLTRVYCQLAKVCQAGIVQNQISALAGLAQGTEPWTDLPEGMRREAYTLLRQALTEKPLKAEDLFACARELRMLDAKEPALLSGLLQAAGLLDIDIDDRAQVESLLANAPQWVSLCGEISCRTSFSPADQQFGKTSFHVSLHPESMLAFLEWYYGRTRGAVPKLVQELTRNAPDWLTGKYRAEPRRLMDILKSISPCDAKNRFVQELMRLQMPSADVGSLLIHDLKDGGLSESELRRFCHPSWGGVIFAEYYDPLQGEQGEMLLSVQKKFESIRDQVRQLYQNEKQAHERVKRKREKILLARSNALGRTLAVFFVLYGLLPLLALFITGLLSAQAAQIWLVAELITAALLALVGCVLLPIGLEEDGRYLRRTAAIGCIGLLPGLLLAVILTVLL